MVPDRLGDGRNLLDRLPNTQGHIGASPLGRGRGLAISAPQADRLRQLLGQSAELGTRAVGASCVVMTFGFADRLAKILNATSIDSLRLFIDHWTRIARVRTCTSSPRGEQIENVNVVTRMNNEMRDVVHAIGITNVCGGCIAEREGPSSFLELHRERGRW